MPPRPDGEQVEHHVFAIGVPTCLQKAAFGFPTVGQQRSAIQHPTPIHSFLNFTDPSLHRFIPKMLPAGEHPTEQDRRVNGRQFAFPFARAGSPIHEVVEKTMLLGHLLPQKAQSRQRALPGFLVLQPATLVSDAQGGQAKAGRCDAGNLPDILACNVTAGFDEARFRMGVLGEELKTGALYREF